MADLEHVARDERGAHGVLRVGVDDGPRPAELIGGEKERRALAGLEALVGRRSALLHALLVVHEHVLRLHALLLHAARSDENVLAARREEENENDENENENGENDNEKENEKEEKKKKENENENKSRDERSSTASPLTPDASSRRPPCPSPSPAGRTACTAQRN